MKKASVHNLGCKVNAYETEVMRNLLEQAGYEIVPFSAKNVDVCVINTCSVTNIADRKSRQMIHRAREHSPNAVIAVVGCYAQTKTEEAMKDPAIDLVIGNNQKNEIVRMIERFLQDRKKAGLVCDINDGVAEYEAMFLERTTEHTRAFLKVQDGCNQFCSYCIIPYARGRVRSRELSDVLQEVRHLAETGYKEVVLTGIHLSSYGTDTGDTLLHLIKEVCAVDGIERVRLGSLEPGIINEDFVREIAALPKLCPHFHLSLQSGCDATLARMNRKYTTAEYEAGCVLLRKYFHDPAITTDVIVGFPGETEEEFAQTKAFLEKIRFYELHMFKYSRRHGTRADTMEDQVPEPIKTMRGSILIALGEELSREFRESYKGTKQSVLLEEELMINGERYFTGYTREYIKVAVKTAENMENRMVEGTVGEMLRGGIYLLTVS